MTPALRSCIESYFASNPPGWCWLEKALTLAEAASTASLAVEIGVFGARSLIPIAMALAHYDRDGFAWGIDPWRKESALSSLDPVTDAAHIDWWSKVDLDKVHSQAAAAIWDNHLQGSCALIRVEGHQALPLFKRLTLDLLHIDGCHVESAALHDVQAWLPLVRPGGYIMMDDTNWPSTQAAVRELERSCTQLQVLTAPGGEARLYQKRA